MIKLTDSAKEHLKTLLKENNKKYVRLQVKGGGCAGFEYQWLWKSYRSGGYLPCKKFKKSKRNTFRLYTFANVKNYQHNYELSS